MFSLTVREQFLVAGVLCALVTGAAVKHWRGARRATGPATTVMVAPGATVGARLAKSP